MPTTGQQRVPLDEAWRIATGQEPPPPMTEEEQQEFDALLAKADREHERIYGKRDEGEVP
jgi:hypothetical protein